MKKESKFQIIKITLFLLIITSLITINSINKSKVLNIDNQVLPNKEEIIPNKVIEEDIISIEDLKGTCPRGRSCTTPSCSLWSDLNKNNMCDRGEK